MASSSSDLIHKENNGARENNVPPPRSSTTPTPTTTTLRITNHEDAKNGSLIAATTMTATNTVLSSKDPDSSHPPPTTTISYLFAALLKQQQQQQEKEDSLYCNFITPSFKQSLFVFVVFVLGIHTGINYVGWVQQNYGFGKDPAMEIKCLPFWYGPNTHHQQQTFVAELQRKSQSAGAVLSTANQRQNIPTLRKEHENPVLSTLFGLEYSLTRPPVPLLNASETNDNVTTTLQPPPPPSAALVVSSSWYSKASNKRVLLTPNETDMIQSVALKVHNNIPDLEERSIQVSWGGPHDAIPITNWWSTPQQKMLSHPNNNSNSNTSSSSNLSELDGGHLLYAYLFIMKWNSNPHFPFRLCGENGCPPERAISHTLQWREAYKPWLAPPSLLEENRNGYAYHRGFSPSETPNGKHGIVWLRLRHTVKHNLSFFRGILHSADRAIANALIESHGDTGKFNVIIDCDGFSLKGTPTLKALQQGVTMLQDHYPNRLGMIFLVHLSRAGEVFLKVVLSLITKDVRDKIKILPSHDKPKRLAILKTVVEEEYIPDWLGGTDTYRFDTKEYYLPHHMCSEEEAKEFLTTMPYHTK